MLNSTVTTSAVSAAFHSAAMPSSAAAATFAAFTWHTTHNARANAAAYSTKANKYGKSGTWGGTIG